jgi:hypothetical protein
MVILKLKKFILFDFPVYCYKLQSVVIPEFFYRKNAPLPRRRRRRGNFFYTKIHVKELVLNYINNSMV